MNCEEVKSHLLDYLDKALDTPMMTRIATHLISCAPCAVEANGLADCIEQVGSLPVVDVPIGFTQRVMAHAREIGKKPPFWQVWLLPWSGKLPLQLTALVLVGFMGLLLYQKEEQLKSSQSRQSVTESLPLEAPKAPAEAKLPATPPSESLSNPAPELTGQVAERIVPPAAKKSQPSRANEPSQAAKNEAEALAVASRAPRRPPIQVQEASTLREPAPFLRDSADFSQAVPFAAVRHAAPRSPAMERFVPSLAERIADHEFVVRRRPLQRRDADEGLSAQSLEKSTDPDSSLRVAAPPPASAPKIESIAEIRFYNVAPEHFEFFKKELASEAVIESESPATGNENDSLAAGRQLLIKVTILPPAPPDPPVSTR